MSASKWLRVKWLTFGLWLGVLARWAVGSGPDVTWEWVLALSVWLVVSCIGLYRDLEDE